MFQGQVGSIFCGSFATLFILILYHHLLHLASFHCLICKLPPNATSSSRCFFWFYPEGLIFFNLVKKRKRKKRIKIKIKRKKKEIKIKNIFNISNVCNSNNQVWPIWKRSENVLLLDWQCSPSVNEFTISEWEVSRRRIIYTRTTSWSTGTITSQLSCLF